VSRRSETGDFKIVDFQSQLIGTDVTIYTLARRATFQIPDRPSDNFEILKNLHKCYQKSNQRATCGHLLTMSISNCADTKGKDYVTSLEERLGARSDKLEEIHMEAAIDAQLTDTNTESSIANPVIAAPLSSERQETLFDDYVNPNAVSNCLSPYVPTQAEKIAAFCSFVGLKADDFLLDIGCGDGRVCIAAATIAGCRAIGIDVSPPCIVMANEVAREEGLSESQCAFFEADATVNPDIILAGEWIPRVIVAAEKDESVHLT
jgi:predicted TPR repeat methyltransferase